MTDQYMKFIKSLILVVAMFAATTAMAGRAVDLTWNTPADAATVPYSGFKISWTDVNGVVSVIDVNDPAATSVTVPDVPFGNSTWRIASVCESCQVQESPMSVGVGLTVISNLIPTTPALTVTLGAE